jgi:hypothetical protein
MFFLFPTANSFKMKFASGDELLPNAMLILGGNEFILLWDFVRY